MDFDGADKTSIEFESRFARLSRLPVIYKCCFVVVVINVSVFLYVFSVISLFRRSTAQFWRTLKIGSYRGDFVSD